ncbi:MAG: PKD domain-containing protein [Rikenellaceae bacterium]
MRRVLIPLISIFAIISCAEDSENGGDNVENPYIAKVYDFQPAPGQYVNTLPAYTEGESKEDILAKIEAGFAGTGSGTMISLGGFGGYVVFGFEQSVINRDGLCDLRIYGNAFDNSHEPGIVMVSRDDNANGIPDDTWYEIKGSDHDNDSTIAPYSITYISDGTTSIAWSDSEGDSGTVTAKFPGWISDSELTFTGTRLADIYTEDDSYWSATALSYGYVDNQTNSSDRSAIDIGWAVDSQGNPANLESIDFVKVYNSQRQVAGTLGEVSTEVAGAEDLHILGTEIYSSSVMAE